MMLTTLILSLLTMAALPQKAVQPAAPESGNWIYVYPSYNDYATGRPADSLNLMVDGNHFKTNMDRLVLQGNGSKRKYSTTDTWGFTLGGQLYRYYLPKNFFSPVGYFRVVDTNGLVLYDMQDGGNAIMTMSGYVTFYYSKSLNSPIKILNARHLKRDFKDLAPFLKGVLSLNGFTDGFNEASIHKVNLLYREYE